MYLVQLQPAKCSKTCICGVCVCVCVCVWCVCGVCACVCCVCVMCVHVWCVWCVCACVCGVCVMCVCMLCCNIMVTTLVPTPPTHPPTLPLPPSPTPHTLRCDVFLKHHNDGVQGARDPAEQDVKVGEVLKALLPHHGLGVGVEVVILVVLHQMGLTLPHELGRRYNTHVNWGGGTTHM